MVRAAEGFGYEGDGEEGFAGRVGGRGGRGPRLADVSSFLVMGLWRGQLGGD